MPRNERLSGPDLLLWVTLGLGTGLIAGLVLSEWAGGVDRGRVGRIARRLRNDPLPHLNASASVRAVQAALQAEPRLEGVGVETIAVGRGVVELRGWVPSRAARALAGRTALAVSGIASVINSVQVHGEDDLVRPSAPRDTDQSA